MLNIINPATEEIIAKLEEDNELSVTQKFKQAKAAQPRWAQTSYRERAKCIERFRELIEAHRDNLALTLTAEMGKPIVQARNELNALRGRLDFFLEHTEALVHEEECALKSSALEERITYEPLGVIGNISAWNYPYFVGTNVFIPALLTGNAVLYKPSEFSTLSGQKIAELLHEAGVPKDIFAPIVGGGAAGSALLTQPLAALFFTGSYATGVKVAKAAAEKLTKTQMELGGKDPVYVCEDVDITIAAQSIADGAFYNTGQSCCAVERVYVHNAIYDRFVAAFLETVKGFKIGDPREESTYIGPLARKQQLAYLEEQVHDAIAKGAKVLCGGKKINGKGFYFEPTVLVQVDHSMKVMCEESFGPIIGIQEVNGDTEAVQLMNDTPYGLTAGVYTSNRGRAEKILREINAGTAYINCCDRVSPKLPWSGRQHSGIGSTLSHIGIKAFMQPKAWHIKNKPG